MRLFLTTGEREQGRECDCCVQVVAFRADVFARDEQMARDIVGNAWKFNQIRVDTLEDKGSVEQVQTPGIKVDSQTEVWRGYHGSSPFSQSTARA